MTGPIYNQYMKSISTHVSPQAYERFRVLASRRGRSVAELIREAMDAYLAEERQQGPSLRDIPARRSGRLKKKWTRAELVDEMRHR